MANITAVPGNKFTDEMLANNFMAITSALKDVEEWSYLIESRLGELVRLAEAAKNVKPPARLKPFIVGAAIGVLVYRYTQRNQAKIEKIKREAQERLDDLIKTDVDAPRSS